MSREKYDKIIADSGLPSYRFKRYDKLTDADKKALGLVEKKPAAKKKAKAKSKK
jgi:hypothetical protein